MQQKIFITEEYAKKLQGIIKKKNDEYEELLRVRGEAAADSWHDNFAYESATEQVKIYMNELKKLTQEMSCYVVSPNVKKIGEPKFVELWTLVKLLEIDKVNTSGIEKTIGIVPMGGEDFNKFIYNYRTPIVAPLMGAKIGDVRTISTPARTYDCKVLDIKRFPLDCVQKLK